MSAKNTLHLTIYDPFILRPSDKRDRLLQWSFRRPPIFFQNAWFSRYVDWSLFAHGLSLLCNLSVPIGNWRLYSTWNDWRWICHININHGRKSCFFCCSANLYILIEVLYTGGDRGQSVKDWERIQNAPESNPQISRNWSLLKKLIFASIFCSTLIESRRSPIKTRINKYGKWIWIKLSFIYINESYSFFPCGNISHNDWWNMSFTLKKNYNFIIHIHWN